MRVCLLLLAFAASAFADVCGSGVSLPDADYKTLVENIKNAPMSREKLLVLGNWTNSSVYGVTGLQTTGLVSLFGFSSDQMSAIDLLSSHLLSLTCADNLPILKLLGFSNDKLKVLPQLLRYTIGDDIRRNGDVLLTLFSFSSDIAEAKRIIAASKGISCTWGPIVRKRVVFVIDVSGSMATQFGYNGSTYTRLSFVQKEIDEVIRYQLQADQWFNVLSFSSGVTSWQPGLVPVVPANVDAAVTFARRLVPGGSTNTAAALTSAFNQPNVLAVYLLSDGEPDNRNLALQTATNLVARFPGVPIYATALAADAGGKSFMKEIATISRGVYREINSK